MIKVNLLRSIGLDQVGGGLGDVGGVVSAEIVKQAAMKLGLILLIPILLTLYEKFHLSTLQAEARTAEEQIGAIQQQISTFGPTAPRVEKYTKEKSKIEKEIDVISALTRNRLREVKALDALQNTVPPQTWFQKVSIEGNTVRLNGFTQSQDGLSDLIRRLQDSVFSQIETRGTSRVDLATGPAMSFELEFRVGKE